MSPPATRAESVTGAAPAVLAAEVGISAARGFRAGAAAAGIRSGDDRGRLDVALIVSDRPCAGAGVFTRNTVKAAPVAISQLTLRRGNRLQAIVVNAGNANACTGAQGLRDALVMCSTAAECLDLDPSQVLVCSTGVIGRPMPMERVTAGIRAAARGLSSEAGPEAARAIMTTDTRPKSAAAALTVGGRPHAVGGIAKGAGMIHPDMATLLTFLTTDVAAPATLLQPMLRRVVDDTLNCVTVDGDSSTNDTVLLLANGAGGGAELVEGSPGAAALEAAMLSVLESLAEQIVGDAEGAGKHFRVLVTGAMDGAQARTAARAVAGSTLVKTAIHGADPNWGRIVAALGRSGAAFTLDRCSVSIGGVAVFAGGAPLSPDEPMLRSHLGGPRVEIAVDLGAGEGRGRAWGCDLTADYIRINADYTT